MGRGFVTVYSLVLLVLLSGCATTPKGVLSLPVAKAANELVYLVDNTKAQDRKSGHLDHPMEIYRFGDEYFTEKPINYIDSILVERNSPLLKGEKVVINNLEIIHVIPVTRSSNPAAAGVAAISYPAAIILSEQTNRMEDTSFFKCRMNGEFKGNKFFSEVKVKYYSESRSQNINENGIYRDAMLKAVSECAGVLLTRISEL